MYTIASFNKSLKQSSLRLIVTTNLAATIYIVVIYHFVMRDIVAGLEIATNTVANKTNFSSFGN